MNNVELKKSTGEILKADLLCHFKIINTQKEYVFYTLNEIVENGLVKMYVAEAETLNNVINTNSKMTDDEWAILKSIMKDILTGNQNNNIQFLGKEA